MFASPMFMCLAAAALGGFVGFDRTLVRASNAVGAHALSAALGCLTLLLVLFPGFDEIADLSHDRIVETLILATIIALPVALICQGFVMVLLAIDARGYPPGDLVSLSSAAWFGAICASGSWRMMLLCTLALTAIAIFRPRHNEDGSDTHSEDFALTPMVGPMMVPTALNASMPHYPALVEQMAIATAPIVSGLGRAPEDAKGPRPKSPGVSDQPRVVLRPLSPARRVLPLEDRLQERMGTSPSRLISGDVRRSGRLLRDARNVRGYSLRHHRGLLTNAI